MTFVMMIYRAVLLGCSGVWFGVEDTRSTRHDILRTEFKMIWRFLETTGLWFERS
jgi:uncharacterized membrane protein YsdA (DUF1294 family)